MKPYTIFWPKIYLTIICWSCVTALVGANFIQAGKKSIPLPLTKRLATRQPEAPDLEHAFFVVEKLPVVSPSNWLVFGAAPDINNQSQILLHRAALNGPGDMTFVSKSIAFSISGYEEYGLLGRHLNDSGQFVAEVGDWSTPNSKVFRFDGTQLVEEKSFSGVTLQSINNQGWLLAARPDANEYWRYGSYFGQHFIIKDGVQAALKLPVELEGGANLFSLSDAGEAIGSGYLGQKWDYWLRAIYFGVKQDFHYLAGNKFYEEAYAINQYGQIVGATATTSNNLLPAYWEQSTVPVVMALPMTPHGGGRPYAWANDINRWGHIVGFWEWDSGILWLNGKEKDLTKRVVNPEELQLGSFNRINDKGEILGMEFAGLANPPPQRTFVMRPAWAILGADVNRDGQLTYGNEDISDSTTSDKPYRFWVNDDIDRETGGEEDVETGTKNCDDDVINGKRDLEDFARLSVWFSGVEDAVKNGKIKVGLKWKNPGSSTPSIKVWRNLSLSGGREYLTDLNVAQQHLALSAPGLVKDATTYIIPTQFWTDVSLSVSQPYGNLLFEGCTPGKGQLVVVLLKPDGTEISEASSIWIELKGIKELYEHWTCGDTDAPNTDVTPTAGHPTDSSFEYASGGDGLSVPGAVDYNEYLLFVHGWRLQPWERRGFAETAFKRLYHQGYKGKFGMFSWPTEWESLEDAFHKAKNAATDPQHYDRCEVIARQAGARPLKTLLTTLKDIYGKDNVGVFAHSMGNIVVSEALRANPEGTALIDTYVACQSAEVAHTYDPDVGSPNQLQTGIPDRYRYNPPSPRLMGYNAQGDNYHRGLGTRANRKFINFANLTDIALNVWDLNQRLKPDTGWWANDTAFAYNSTYVSKTEIRDVYLEDPPGIDPLNQEHEIYWPGGRFTILAHITPAASRATGAVTGMGGEFAGEVDLGLSPYAFGAGDYSHSAEFLSNFAERRAFYFQLMAQFRLTPYPLDNP